MSTQKVYQTLLKHGWTIAFAESITGGALCAEMVKIPGASKVLLGSIVSYSTFFKEEILGIEKNLILSEGSVSLKVSDQMAFQIQSKTHADICVAITGNAGPSFELGSTDKIAYISFLIHDEIHRLKLDFGTMNRKDSIDYAVRSTYQKLAELLSQKEIEKSL